MKQVRVGSRVALVDDEDIALVCGYRWGELKPSGGRETYAVAGDGILMHRLIMGLQKGDKRQVDHREPGNGLDNRRSNLRIADQFGNQANRGKNSNNKSGYKGVSWHKKRGVWVVSVGFHGRQLWVGRYKNLEDAVEAYKQACLKHHGEFARFDDIRKEDMSLLPFGVDA